MKSILSLFFVLAFAFGVKAQESFIKNQVIVLMHNSSDPVRIVEQFNAQYPELNLEIERTLSVRAHIHLLNFNDNKYAVKQVVDIVKSNDHISLAQPNHDNVSSRSTIPNDLEYPVQWSVGSNAPARIFAPEAWDISTDGITLTGDTIVVAVVDGGMDLNHIDLNLFKNKHEIPLNGIDDDGNGYIDDYDGWSAYTQSGVISNDDHGTHIAGTIGAKTNNSEGVAGIMWGGMVVPINASSRFESVVIEGYGYALEMRKIYNESNGDSGAFIVATNSSFGIDRGDPADYPIWCAFYDSLGAAGILNMGATSNSGLDVDSLGDIPTTCPSNFMISVSNVNRNGSILGGYGATEIDLAAPGTDIRSTEPNQSYGFKTGTSMATPHVAGVVGAMYSAMCGFDLTDAFSKPDSLSLWVRQKLLESVDTVPNLAGLNITSGRLNMFKALQAVQTGTMDIDYQRTAASNSTAADGSITVMSQGGTNPKSYSWDSGQNTATISNLAPGVYTVSITEKYGCVSSESIDIWTVGFQEDGISNAMVIFPNPSNEFVIIQFSNPLLEEETLEVFDVLGKRVIQTILPANTSEYSLNHQLSKGVYVVRFGSALPTSIIVN